MLPTTLRVWVSSLPPASLCAPLSSGIMAISGIAAMSWNSRMAKARRPWGWVSSLRSARICRPKAVDDSARPRPSTTALFTGWSKPTRATVPITRPVSSTCSRPTPNTDLRITHRRRGDSLQADDEQQQYHAHLGDLRDAFRVVHQAQHAGTDQHAGQQVAEHRAQLQTLGQRHHEHRRDQEDHAGLEKTASVFHAQLPLAALAPNRSRMVAMVSTSMAI